MKVLVVEAEEAVLKATGVMLNKLGYEVGLAPNCSEALRIYTDKGPHDVVLIALKFLRSSSAGGAKLILREGVWRPRLLECGQRVKAGAAMKFPCRTVVERRS